MRESIKKKVPYAPIKATKTISMAVYLDTECTYEVYCSNLDDLYKVEAIEWKKMLPRPMLQFYEGLKVVFSDIAKQAKVGVDELVLAFKNKDIFNLFKAVHFNLKTLWRAIHEFTALIPKGLVTALEELQQSAVGKGVARGTKVIDELLAKHPVLKKLAGPAIAGLLLWMWMNCSFVGNVDFDFDMSYIVDAFTGHYTLYDLFASPDGLANVITTLSGLALGISFPWLLSNTASLLVAIAYTGAKQLKDRDLTKKLYDMVPLKRL
jgi:hypothetical protein